MASDDWLYNDDLDVSLPGVSLIHSDLYLCEPFTHSLTHTHTHTHSHTHTLTHTLDHSHTHRGVGWILTRRVWMERICWMIC